MRDQCFHVKCKENETLRLNEPLFYRIPCIVLIWVEANPMPPDSIRILDLFYHKGDLKSLKRTSLEKNTSKYNKQSTLGTDIKRKQNSLAVYWTKSKIMYKFCCVFSHLDLLEYKTGLFPTSYFWIGEPSRSILHHAELFSKLYMQDDYFSLSSLLFIPSAAGCNSRN